MRWHGIPPAAILAVAACLLAQASLGFSITNNRSVNGGANLVGDGGTIVPRSGPVYDWDNIEGAGTDASDNLDLGSYQITSSDGTSISLRLRNSNGKGNLTGTAGLGLSATSATGDGGSILIQDVGNIDMGGIAARPVTAYTRRTGNITIGASTNRAGNIRVDYLYTHTDSNSREQYTGDITVYGGGHVRIRTRAGTPGDIMTWTRCNWAGTDTAGEVLIDHSGEFVANQIDTHAQDDDYSKGGSVVLNGGSGMATCTVNRIDASHIYPSAFSPAYRGGNISISNYACVNINTAKTSYVDREIRITGIARDINLGVAESSGVYTNTVRYFGFLRLEAGGTATLGSLDMQVSTNVYLKSGGRRSLVLGRLDNFDTNNPAMSGLDTPLGYRIIYNYVPGGLNAYLGGKEYTLASGGQLSLMPKAGLVVVLK